MAYCTQAQVESEFKHVVFTTTTSVTDTDITRFIAEADAEINAQVGTRYETPVTTGDALLIMRKISILLVAARIKDILQVKMADKEREQDTRGGAMRAEAKRLLDAIIKGTMLLPGATLASSADGVRGFCVDEAIEHNFQRNVDQW
jgi:hypothetical protein